MAATRVSGGLVRAIQPAVRATAPTLQPPLAWWVAARVRQDQTASWGGHPVHFVEGGVVDVVGVDARAQPAHEPGTGGLPEDGRSDGVDADQFQVGGAEPAQHAGDAGGVSAGAHRAHQGVDAAELGDQFEGE